MSYKTEISYLVNVLFQLWPLMSNIAEKFKHDERVTERICRFVSQLIVLTCFIFLEHHAYHMNVP